MLNEIRPLLNKEKIKDILNRLKSKEPEQALPAEMELALLVGMNKVAKIEIEKMIPNDSRKPEAYSEDLFDSPAYIEITAISDGKLSGEAVMQRASQKFVEAANKIKKGSGNYLYLTFSQKQEKKDGKYSRTHHVSDKFDLSIEMIEQLQNWLHADRKNILFIENEEISVKIEFKTYKQIVGHNFFCSLPPLAYDIEDNPVYAALKSKRSQLSKVPNGTLKVIFLADVGSDILRRLEDRDSLGGHKSGAEIIWYFLSKNDIDLVCVFSPYRDPPWQVAFEKLIWKATCFDRGNKKIDTSKLKNLTATLPIPRFEGYQARSLHKQGAYKPSAGGWYLGQKLTTKGKNGVTVKFSARAFQDFLAGRISKELFLLTVTSHYGIDKMNTFEFWLSKGLTISDAKFEKTGIDEDDDYVVLNFSPDPAASDFK